MEMKIMQPITVGGITLKNRIMFPPLTTGYEERDGSIGEQSRAFYTRLAQAVWDTSCWATLRPFAVFLPRQSCLMTARLKVSVCLQTVCMPMAQSWASRFSSGIRLRCGQRAFRPRENGRGACPAAP